MTAILVGNAAELTKALARAHGGDTILLKSGVDFGKLVMYKPTNQYDSMVTIKSEDPDHPANFSGGMGLTGIKNITFDSIKIDIDPNVVRVPLVLYNSNNIVFKNSEIDGNLKLGVAGQPQTVGTDIRNNTNITFDNNNIHNLHVGTAVGLTDNITFSNNFYHDNLGDNAEFGSDLSNVYIKNNTFYAPDPANPNNIHQDNIQFWVEKDAHQDTSHVVISGNTIIDNTNTHSQSIFMRGDYLQPDANGNLSNQYRLKDVTIENNVIAATHSNAISLAGTDGIVIKNNTLVYNGDEQTPNSVYVPQISVRAGNTDAVISNNIVPEVYGYFTTPDVQYQDNTMYQIGNDSLSNLLFNPNADNLTPADLATMHVNPDGSYQGALITTADNAHPTAIINQNYQLVDGHYQYTFDASGSLAKAGLDLTGAQYVWNFADGTKLTGATVNKVFTVDGPQDVTLTVTDRLGNSDSLVKNMPIHDPVAIKMNFDGNLIDQSGTASLLSGITTPTYVDGAYGGKALHLSGTDHLTFNRNDVDLSNLTQLTFAVSINALQADNTKNISLLNNHGSWLVSLIPTTGNILFAADGKFMQLKTGVNLLDGKWHDIAFTIDHDSFSFFADGKKSFEIALTPAQATSIFATTNYGLSINADNTFNGNIDNLYLGSTALTDKQIGDMVTSNHHSDVIIPVTAAPIVERAAAVVAPVPLGLTIDGTSAADTLTGTDRADTISGGDGKDTLNGGDGNDRLDGGLQSDILNGGRGNDILIGGHGSDMLTGGEGSDKFVVEDIQHSINAGNKFDTITDFQPGEDKIDLSAIVGYRSIVAQGTATEVGQLEYAVTKDGIMLYDSFSNFGIKILGISSLSQSDIIFSTSSVNVTSGDDNYQSTDTDSSVANHFSVVVDMGNGNDSFKGGIAEDAVYGGAGNDKLDGGGGNDRISGGDGSDILLGGSNSDYLEGGKGNDRLIGGMHKDYLLGGNGADSFVFGKGESTVANGDTIGDFKSGLDKIELNGFGDNYHQVMLVNENSTATGDSSTLVLHTQQQSDGSLFIFNNDIDLGITLEAGHTIINANDFLL